MEWSSKAAVRMTVYHAGMRLLRAAGVTRLPGLSRRGLGAILTLHHVGPMETDPFDPNRGLTVTPEFLDAALAWLRSEGFRFVSLAELHERIVSGRTEPDAPVIALTLDDGYRDNRDLALPVFARHGAPFTVFVTTGFSERREILWWEVLARVLRRAATIRFDFGAGPETIALPDLAARTHAWTRIRTWVSNTDQVRARQQVAALAEAHGFDALALTGALTLDRDELAAFAQHPLVTIGAHTLTHPMLSTLPRDAALAEMRGSADTLADWLGARPRFLAFPYGFRSAAGPREFALAAEAGFDLAVTTRPGMVFSRHRDHRTALPRVSLNGEFQTLADLAVLMSGAPFVLMNRFRLLDVA